MGASSEVITKIMSKLILTDLANLQNDATATSQINANSAAIEAAFDNTLSRDGTSPNSMAAAIDMNSHAILNLPAPTTDNEPLRKVDYAPGVSADAAAASAAAASASQTAAAGSATSAGASATSASTSATNAAASAVLAASYSGVGAVRYDGAQTLTGGQQSQAQSNIGLGTAATKNTGTAAGNVVVLDGSAKLPAVDGSQLTNLPASTVPFFDTRAALLLSNLSSTNAVWVARYSTSTPYAPALFVKLGSTPSPVKAWHAGPDAGGHYWELRTRVIQPEMLGAVGDNTTDDVAACQAAIDYTAFYGSKVFVTRFYLISTFIGHADGTDPGGLVIEGIGADLCGFSHPNSAGLYFPATGSSRHSWLKLKDFKLDGQNTGGKNIYINNALSVVIDGLHLIRAANHSIHLDYTTSYGHLQVIIQNCKTSPTTNPALSAANQCAVRVDNGNYLILMNNYFSGFQDALHSLNTLVWFSGDDSPLSLANIFESANHAIRFENTGNASTIVDRPVGSAIYSSNFQIAANNDTLLLHPRGITGGNFASLVDRSEMTTGHLYLVAYLNEVGWVSGT